MTLTVTHAKVSAVADEADSSKVRPSDWNANHTVTGSMLPRSYLAGFGLSNNSGDATNDIDIAVGECKDSTNVEDIVLTSALTKRLDANWAVGTNQGGLDTGAVANGTYHVWAIKRSDTGVEDVLFSTSASSPTMPTNYDYKRCIGSILREGGAIVGFVQYGDTFLRKVPINSIDVTNPGTSAVDRVLHVPVGRVVEAIIAVQMRAVGTAQQRVLITAKAQTDTAAAAEVFSTSDGDATSESGGMARVFTDTAATIRSRHQASAAGDVFRIVTHGWVDRRGRDD